MTFARLLHHGQRSCLLRCLGLVVMMVDKLPGCQIPDGTVRPLFIVLSSPGFNHKLGFP